MYMYIRVYTYVESRFIYEGLKLCILRNVFNLKSPSL